MKKGMEREREGGKRGKRGSSDLHFRTVGVITRSGLLFAGWIKGEMVTLNRLTGRVMVVVSIIGATDGGAGVR